MLLQEIRWIRKHRAKLCPVLRKELINSYRPVRYVPWFLYRLVRSIKHSFNKMPIIVEYDSSIPLDKVDLRNSFSLDVQENLPSINAFMTEINLKDLKLLVENDKVSKVWYDKKVSAFLDKN